MVVRKHDIKDLASFARQVSFDIVALAVDYAEALSFRGIRERLADISNKARPGLDSISLRGGFAKSGRILVDCC